MALLWLDSFDHYATADLATKYQAATNSTIIAAAGRHGSACLRTTFAAVNIATPPFTPGDNTVIVGFAFKTPTIGSDMIVQIRTGTTVQITLGINASGFVYVARGISTILRTATIGALSPSAYYFIELKAVIHPSAGSFIVRLNELEVLNETGVNTAASGSAVWANVAFVNNLSGNRDHDDLYILDGSGAAPLNDLIGDCRVDARYPTAEGASSQWTPLSGSDNALMVDDPPPGPDGDSTYNSTSTVGFTDTHVVQDAPVPGATLYGVQLVISEKKTDAGTCTIVPVVRHGGVDYPGPANNPTTTYLYQVVPYGLNPGTAAAWTEAHFNAAEFGYTRTA